jgi:two-component system sensor histidine kinase MprB
VSLRLKLVLALAVLSATATAVLGAWSYVATRDRLHAEIDRSIASALREVDLPRGPRGPVIPGGADRPGPAPGLPRFEQVLFQVLGADGDVIFEPSTPLPVGEPERRLLAEHSEDWVWREVEIDGEPFRMASASVRFGGGVTQAARSLAETERVLDSLLTRTIAAVLAVTAAAAAAGWFIARQVTRRIARLTSAAEEVAATGRLDVPVPAAGGDEAGRLGRAFDQMLRALASSRDAQQRLVQDAGHELRTPLTSLRTNISVLRRHEKLPDGTREQVLTDLDEEAQELTALVNELVELATDLRDDEPPTAFALGPVAERAAERARRRSRRGVVVHADDSVVDGHPDAVERAITNLLDNATKFDESAAPIEVEVAGGTVTVADRGPGIPEADQGRVFDRFYRTLDARSRPGSGLGLAIVRDVAERHQGTVFARSRPGGGTEVGFTLPTVE